VSNSLAGRNRYVARNRKGDDFMQKMIAGLVLLGLGGALFWYMLPRGGRRHRFVETELEPYIGVAFTAAVAVAFTLMLSGAIDVWG
jgi:hypothetical protein